MYNMKISPGSGEGINNIRQNVQKSPISYISIQTGEIWQPCKISPRYGCQISLYR